MTKVTAKLKNLDVAPRKVRLIANTLRNLPVQEAEAQLLYRAQRSSEPLLKLLRSAVANAKENAKLDPKTLFISEIYVDGGQVLKRSMPRAQGRATPIAKRRSHVTIIVSALENPKEERFSIQRAVKEKVAKKEPKKIGPKTDTSVETKTAAPKVDRDSGASKTDQKKGVFKKMFNRKVI